MDTDRIPSTVKPSSNHSGHYAPLLKNSDQLITEEEDPYSLNGPSMALIGLAIAISAFCIPIVAVFIERPQLKEIVIPKVLDRDGLKSPSSLSFSRIGEFSS